MSQSPYAGSAETAAHRHVHILAKADVKQTGGIADTPQNRADLRLALQRNEFVVHYQPTINIDTGVVSGWAVRRSKEPLPMRR